MLRSHHHSARRWATAPVRAALVSVAPVCVALACAAVIWAAPGSAQRTEGDANAWGAPEARVAAAGDIEALAALVDREIAAGRWEQAAGALAALVLRDPDDAGLKLLLADIYLRLGAPAQAQVYVDRARALEMDAEDGRTAAALQALLDGPATAETQAFFLNGQIESGVRYRTNINGGTSNGSILIDDELVDAGRAAAIGDYDWFATGFAALGIPLGARAAIDTRGVVFVRRQVEESDFDLLAGRLTPGLSWRAVQARGYGLTVRPYAVLGASGFGGHLAQLNAGAGLTLRQRVGNDWRFRQSVEALVLDFKENGGRRLANEQDGTRTRLTLDARHDLTDWLEGSLRYAFAFRTAAEDYNAYTSHQLGAGARFDYPLSLWQEGVESSFALSAEIGWDRYADNNPTLSATTVRRDFGWQVEAIKAFGVTDDVSLDLRASYGERRSSLENFEQDATEVGVSLRWRF